MFLNLKFISGALVALMLSGCSNIVTKDMFEEGLNKKIGAIDNNALSVKVYSFGTKTLNNVSSLELTNNTRIKFTAGYLYSEPTYQIASIKKPDRENIKTWIYKLQAVSQPDTELIVTGEASITLRGRSVVFDSIRMDNGSFSDMGYLKHHFEGKNIIFQQTKVNLPAT